MEIVQPRSISIQKAFSLEWFTLIWMILEAAVAVELGIMAHNQTLIAFDIDSVIEIASACVLIWRLTVELKRGQEFSEAAERRASKIGGFLLFALAIYVIASASWELWHRQGAEFSLVGMILAIIAIPTMYFLARAKIEVAALKSSALRATAIETIACGYLSFVVILGLIAEALFHAWWIDSVTSLVIVYFILKEGLEAWNEDCCKDSF